MLVGQSSLVPVSVFIKPLVFLDHVVIIVFIPFCVLIFQFLDKSSISLIVTLTNKCTC